MTDWAIFLLMCALALPVVHFFLEMERIVGFLYAKTYQKDSGSVKRRMTIRALTATLLYAAWAGVATSIAAVAVFAAIAANII